MLLAGTLNGNSSVVRLWRTTVITETGTSTDLHQFYGLLYVNFLFLSFLPIKYDDSAIVLVGLLRAVPDM